LEECIQSLVNQTVKTNILLATSTPCSFIEDLCAKYDIPYHINTGEHGITQDWNFAVSLCETEMVTVAHQDDVYYPTYVETLLECVKTSNNPIIFFSEYAELRNGEYVVDNRNLKIKRFLLAPLKVKTWQKSKWIRRRILSMGDPICCPAVTFFRSNTPEVIFNNHFRTDEDWEAWEMLSKRKGEFLYYSRPQMAHRIHEGSETSATIRETGRSSEDFEMYCKFWPKWIARILCSAYKNSEKSNDL